MLVNKNEHAEPTGSSTQDSSSGHYYGKELCMGRQRIWGAPAAIVAIRRIHGFTSIATVMRNAFSVSSQRNDGLSYYLTAANYRSQAKLPDNQRLRMVSSIYAVANNQNSIMKG